MRVLHDCKCFLFFSHAVVYTEFFIVFETTHRISLIKNPAHCFSQILYAVQNMRKLWPEQENSLPDALCVVRVKFLRDLRLGSILFKIIECERYISRGHFILVRKMWAPAKHIRPKILGKREEKKSQCFRFITILPKKTRNKLIQIIDGTFLFLFSIYQIVPEKSSAAQL